LTRAGWVPGATADARVFAWRTEFFEPRIAAVLLEQALRGGALRVAQDGSFVVLPSGATVTVPGRGKLQNVLLTLANARASEPGAFVGPQALIDSAWPGERIARGAASNRLHVALDHLRRIGLREVLLRGEKGWHLDPAIPFAWADGSEN
jgi:hypothetical protein